MTKGIPPVGNLSATAGSNPSAVYEIDSIIATVGTRAALNKIFEDAQINGVSLSGTHHKGLLVSKWTNVQLIGSPLSVYYTVRQLEIWHATYLASESE